jgi:cytochrome c5
MKGAWALASLLAALSAAGPAGANHDWIGLDLCRTYPERMPPPLDPAVLPDPTGPGARLLGRYCDQCHQAPGPGQHTATEWAYVLARMDLLMDVTARFGDRPRPPLSPDPAERAVLLAYLQGQALRPLADPTQAPPAYRALCGDCHAAPDPAAYAGADWPALLVRMAGHRRVMGRAPADPVSQGRVATYLEVPADTPSMAGPGDAGVDAGLDAEWGRPPPDSRPLAGLPHPWGRWLALGSIFALTLLGLGRWWLRHGDRT